MILLISTSQLPGPPCLACCHLETKRLKLQLPPLKQCPLDFAPQAPHLVAFWALTLQDGCDLPSLLKAQNCWEDTAGGGHICLAGVGGSL
jgi:hypothetical protein